MQKIKEIIKKMKQKQENKSFYQEWDYQRENAMSASHRSEIDAIFARAQTK
jgi:hypothetical protein